MSMPAPSESSYSDLGQKYQVLAELGQGGMSLVHLAAARSLGNVRKLVVLKSIRPELVANEKFRQMFLHEARLATRLNHPNIVQTYEVVMMKGRPVIVMEYMEGQPFSRVLRRALGKDQPLALAVQLLILQDALQGLEHAHNLADFDGRPLNLVHRDVSPQNVFVTYDGHVKILDFGIAKAMNDTSQHTEAGEIKGKIRYMSPEQMCAERIDQRADLFGVGVMLWETLTRKRLWDGMPDVQVINTVLHKGIPSPLSVAPDTNPRLAAICEKALAPNPVDRYATASEFQTDLELACAELGIKATHKDLARVMDQLFNDVRAKLRTAIDAKLKADDSRLLDLSMNESGLFTRSSLDGDFGSSSTPSPLMSDAHFRRERPRRYWPVALLALLGVAAGTVYGLSERPTRDDVSRSVTTVRAVTPTVSVATASTVAVPPAAPVKTVSVKLSAQPAAAKLYLDGTLLPSNPYVAEMPMDSAQHQLRVEAAGHDAKTVAVYFTQQVDLALTLEEQKPRWRAPARKAPEPTKSAAPVVEKKPNCDQPFYVDANGIRRVRSECK
jgi:serine/threonine-protein kinase